MAAASSTQLATSCPSETPAGLAACLTDSAAKGVWVVLLMVDAVKSFRCSSGRPAGSQAWREVKRRTAEQEAKADLQDYRTRCQEVGSGGSAGGLGSRRQR
eukprot:765798-Pelagomonas_calceolata.AAC.1